MLLNDRLLAAGKPPFGFLNPIVYSWVCMTTLFDVHEGDNRGCDSYCFPANKDWVPVTGIGTPAYRKLLAAVGL